MNESEHSEAYGTPSESGMSSDDAAELEELSVRLLDAKNIEDLMI